MKAIGYFVNGIGNYVLQMRAMQAAASLTESKTIDLCTDDNWQDPRRQAVIDICEAWPVIGKVLSWPTDQINEKDYDLWFYSAHGVNCEASYIFLRNMKRTVPKPSWRSSFIHEADHYMDIAYSMGYEGPVPKVVFPVADNPILDLPRPIIGICNGWFRTESREWQKKGWTHFKRLSEVLRHYFGASVVSIGGKDEIPPEVALDMDFCGKLSILQSAKVISQLDILVTTDTGPMHIADILDIPVVALFGGTLTSKNAPRGKNSSILISGLPCVPCQDTVAFYNCHKNACMESISVGDVIATINQKLNRNRNAVLSFSD